MHLFGNNFPKCQIKNGIYLTLFYFPEVSSDSVVCGKVKYVLRVASYKFRCTTSNLQVTSSNPRVVTSNLQVMSLNKELRHQFHELGN